MRLTTWGSYQGGLRDSAQNVPFGRHVRPALGGIPREGGRTTPPPVQLNTEALGQTPPPPRTTDESTVARRAPAEAARPCWDGTLMTGPFPRGCCPGEGAGAGGSISQAGEHRPQDLVHRPQAETPESRLTDSARKLCRLCMVYYWRGFLAFVWPLVNRQWGCSSGEEQAGACTSWAAGSKSDTPISLRAIHFADFVCLFFITARLHIEISAKAKQPRGGACPGPNGVSIAKAPRCRVAHKGRYTTAPRVEKHKAQYVFFPYQTRLTI